MRLNMTRRHVYEMADHVRRGLPYEACGLLGGKYGRVTSVYCTDNADRKPNRFLVDPEDHYRALVVMEQREEDLIAIFHSHPDGEPQPSARDLQLAAHPGVVNLIVAVNDVIRIRGFLFDRPRAIPVRLAVVGGRKTNYRWEYVLRLLQGKR